MDAAKKRAAEASKKAGAVGSSALGKAKEAFHKSSEEGVVGAATAKARSITPEQKEALLGSAVTALTVVSAFGGSRGAKAQLALAGIRAGQALQGNPGVAAQPAAVAQPAAAARVAQPAPPVHPIHAQSQSIANTMVAAAAAAGAAQAAHVAKSNPKMANQLGQQIAGQYHPALRGVGGVIAESAAKNPNTAASLVKMGVNHQMGLAQQPQQYQPQPQPPQPPQPQAPVVEVVAEVDGGNEMVIQVEGGGAFVVGVPRGVRKGQTFLVEL